MNMYTKLFIFALLTATLLSSAMAVNVPVVFAEDHNDDDGNSIKAKNDDGQQSFGINECSNTQKDFENSNNNVQNIDCDILINNLQDVEDTTNTVGNVLPGDGNGPVPTDECAECFATLDAAVLEDLLATLNADDVLELCEFLESGVVDLYQLFVTLAIAGLPNTEINAIIDCVSEALGITA